jgi:DNA polymerase III alpha subunit (gram-positive type)
MLTDDYLYCPECADFRAVDIPDCPDGHGRDCPERACATCGAALWVDPPATPITRSPRKPAHAA